jgi:NAD(P)-dependent dehydrogenase (short-subunit alcohol dehydrogenase family)
VIAAASRFSFDPVEFAGKRVLVTGGTEGMGEAIVRRLVGGGALVATTARSPLREGQTVGLFVQADISTRQGVDKVAEQVLQHFGGLDVLVNTVGGSSAPAAACSRLPTKTGRRRSTSICSPRFAWIEHSFPEC